MLPLRAAYEGWIGCQKFGARWTSEALTLIAKRLLNAFNEELIKCTYSRFMETFAIALRFGGFALAQAAFIVSELKKGELLTPFAVLESDAKQTIDRFYADTQEEVWPVERQVLTSLEIRLITGRLLARACARSMAATRKQMSLSSQLGLGDWNNQLFSCRTTVLIPVVVLA